MDMDGWIYLIFNDQKDHRDLGTMLSLSCVQLVLRNALRVI